MAVRKNYLSYTQEIREQRDPVRVAFIGSGYARTVLTMVSVLTDARFFDEVGECEVRIRSSHGVAITSPRAKLRKEWVNVINGWNSCFLHNEIGDFWELLESKRIVERKDDPFYEVERLLHCLDFFYKPAPYFRNSKLIIACENMIHKEFLTDGLPKGETGGWREREPDDPHGFQYTFEFDPMFFPNESFTIEKILEQKECFTLGQDVGKMGDLSLLTITGGHEWGQTT